MKPQLNWKKDGDYGWQLDVPIKMWEGSHSEGNYFIWIGKRPTYCDRGDWIIQVDGRNDLDRSDGFPRYFFGSEEEVKVQMETWLKRRSAYRNYEGRERRRT
jgi:hypothetical protein